MLKAERTRYIAFLSLFALIAGIYYLRFSAFKSDYELLSSAVYNRSYEELLIKAARIRAALDSSDAGSIGTDAYEAIRSMSYLPFPEADAQSMYAFFTDAANDASDPGYLSVYADEVIMYLKMNRSADISELGKVYKLLTYTGAGPSEAEGAGLPAPCSSDTNVSQDDLSVPNSSFSDGLSAVAVLDEASDKTEANESTDVTGTESIFSDSASESSAPASASLDGTPEISQTEAKKIAAKLIGSSVKLNPVIGSVRFPEVYGFYCSNAFVELTKRGGIVYKLLIEHPVYEAKLSADRCLEAACDFLEENGYYGMTQSSSVLRDGVYIFAFSDSEKRTVSVGVAADNAKVCLFSASGYFDEF